jgi:hypothetical protein
MRFQVGKFFSEMSLDKDGSVQTRWFLRSGRKTEPPKYLDAADRSQYRAGRDAFLRAAGKAPARLPTGASWRTLRRIAPVLVVAAGAVVVLPGCAVQRAVVANDAQEQMVGLTKEQVLGCMGPPAAKAAEGATEVWSYASGNGQTTTVGMSEANGIASGGPGYATGSATGFGIGTATRRFCTVNVTMTGGRVSRVNYVGPTGGLLTPGEQCAFAVENCTQAVVR